MVWSQSWLYQTLHSVRAIPRCLGMMVNDLSKTWSSDGDIEMENTWHLNVASCPYLSLYRKLSNDSSEERVATPPGELLR